MDRLCERIVYGARSGGAAVVLAVADDELEELIGSVAAQANRQPDLRRRRRLDNACDLLETAALHFERLPAAEQ